MRGLTDKRAAEDKAPDTPAHNHPHCLAIWCITPCSSLGGGVRQGHHCPVDHGRRRRRRRVQAHDSKHQQGHPAKDQAHESRAGKADEAHEEGRSRRQFVRLRRPLWLGRTDPRRGRGLFIRAQGRIGSRVRWRRPRGGGPLRARGRRRADGAGAELPEKGGGRVGEEPVAQLPHN